MARQPPRLTCEALRVGYLHTLAFYPGIIYATDMVDGNTIFKRHMDARPNYHVPWQDLNKISPRVQSKSHCTYRDIADTRADTACPLCKDNGLISRGAVHV